MKSLRCTILGEGSSDAILVHPLRWLLAEAGVRRSVELAAADLREWPRRTNSLADRIAAAIALTEPCDLLFVHRDADGGEPTLRREEIDRAFRDACRSALGPQCVPVVPIRETEAWFLFDEGALRSAAGNPRGSVLLGVPSPADLERLPDPKALLKDLLRLATEFPPRRSRGFRPEAAIHRLAELVPDFSPLRRLSAFRTLEDEVRLLVGRHGWNLHPS